MKKKRQAPPSRQSIFPFFIFLFSFFICFACSNPIIERVYNLGKETPAPEVKTEDPPENSPVTYTVNFDLGDGSPVDSQPVAEGATATCPENPIKDGYGFVNWYDDEELSEPPYNFSTPVTDHLTLYAKWIPVYTVAFMDGDAVLSDLSRNNVAHGDTVNRPASDPAKAYHTFDNWYADSGLTVPFVFNTPVTEHTGVYAGWIDADFAGKVIDYTFNVANADEWAAAVRDIIDNGNDKNYVINVMADFSVTGITAPTFGDTSGVTVSLRGEGRTLTLSSSGSVLRTASDQSIILRDLNLRGHESNTSSLVYMYSGTFAMYGGKISGNTASYYSTYGGGVYVDSGTFTMYGGEISGNTAYYGGGVYIASGGTFRIVDGTIYGSGEDDNVKNTANITSSSTLYRLGYAQYGTFGSTWNSNGSLSTNVSDTIRVVNGVLQPNFNRVSANGFPMLTTTALTLAFNRAIPGLSADDIVLSGVYGITKGTLSGPSGSGPVSYLLPVSGFTEGGTLSVSVSKEGYRVGGPRTATIYYASSYIFLFETVTISAGTFTMGSPPGESGRQNIETQHEVTLSGFKMGKYQVTQELYEAVMGTNPSAFNPGGNNNYASKVSGLNTANFPVEQVSWYDAIVFCNKLSMKVNLEPAYRFNDSTDPDDWGPVPTSYDETWNAMQIIEGSNGYRLPTEAQWEYACRAGTWGDNYSAYNWGTDTFDPTQANYRNLDRTSEVGSYAANDWDLYDMHGNVWEWCWDRANSYESGPQTDPTGPVSGSNRIMRGGSWDSYNGEYMRSARREYDFPHTRSKEIGFRLVKP